MKKAKAKGLLERKLEKASYRERFEREYPAFLLEVQILKAMEKKGWSYDDLAHALHTSKGNISRDLAAGGIRKATFTRIRKVAEALGLELVPLLIPRRLQTSVLPKLQSLAAL